MNPVNNIGDNAYLLHRKREKKKKVGKNVSKTGFSRIFSSVSKADNVESPVSGGSICKNGKPVEDFLDKILQAGEKLKENPTNTNISEYKNAVRGFIRLIVKDGIGVEENLSGKNILKRKRFTLIKIIDQKLERLAAEVLKMQREQIDILGKTEEIYGLLIDLMG